MVQTSNEIENLEGQLFEIWKNGRHFVKKKQHLRYTLESIKYLLHKLLSIGGSLEEQLDNGCQQLELNLSVLILEGVQETLQQLVGVVDTLGILANDPNH